MRNLLKNFLVISSVYGLLLWPINSAFAATSSSTSTNCNTIVNSTLKNQCFANKAKADAAAAAAATAAQQAQQVQGQISTISSAISSINDSINSTSKQISDTQSVIDSLSSQITQAEENIKTEKVKLGQIVAAWYMQGDSGLLEAVLGSDSISEVVDAEEQFDSVKQQVNANIDKIKAEEQALNDQKNIQLSKKQELADLQTQQKSQKAASELEKSRKNSLLNMTLAQQKSYLDQAEAAKKEITSLNAQDAAERAAKDKRSGAIISTGGTGGYPYASVAPDSIIDSYANADGRGGFYVRECTSYAAWYWNDRGHVWYNTQPGRGDAKYWDEIAETLHYRTGQSPQVGAIVSWKDIGAHGHVAIVTGINGNGTINVSEYNWQWPPGYIYDTRSNVRPSDYGRYVYIYP